MVEWGLVNAAKVICDRLMKVLCKSSGLPPGETRRIWPCECTQRWYRNVHQGESQPRSLQVFYNNAFPGHGQFGLLFFPMQNVQHSVHGWHQASSGLLCYGLRSCGESYTKAHDRNQLNISWCLVMYSSLQGPPHFDTCCVKKSIAVKGCDFWIYSN